MSVNKKSFYFTLGIMNLLFILLVGVISEFAIREIRPQLTYSRLTELLGEQYTTSDFIPFTLKPHYSAKSPSQEFPGKYVTVSTNKFGLRGKEISQIKPEKTKRILVLGDSYTFGVYVENYETYPFVLEIVLNEDNRRSDKIEVINAGYADGWSPDEHYAWLVNKGLAFQPDIIVYGFFIGNDIPANGARKKQWIEYDNRNLPTKIVNPNIYIDTFGRIKSKVKDDKTVGVEKIYSIPLLRESHLLLYLWRKLSTVIDTNSRRSESGWGSDPFPFILKAKSDPEMLEGEQIFIQLIKGMNYIAKKNEAIFILLMLPINFQVENKFLSKVLGTNKFSIKRNYFDELKPKLDDLNILYLDIYQKMKSIPGNYFPKNGEVHFNPNGHFFTAHQLQMFIHKNGLLATVDNGK